MAEIRRKAIKAQEHFHLRRSPIPRQIIRGGAAPLSNDTPLESVVIDHPVGFVEASNPNIASSQPDSSQCRISANKMTNQWTQIAGPPLVPLSSTTSAPTASTTKNPSTAATPSCAAANSVPMGVPQYLVKVNMAEWCGSLGREGESVGCDDKYDGGFYLSTSCEIPNVPLDYNYPDVIMTLEVAITKSSTFAANETICNQGLLTVLNYCPPAMRHRGKSL